jgi:hypothetical protein
MIDKSVIQHKEGLGHRVVEKVEVMNLEDYPMDDGFLHLVFHIKGVNEETRNEGPEEPERSDDGIVIF